VRRAAIGPFTTTESLETEGVGVGVTSVVSAAGATASVSATSPAAHADIMPA
jgi:hypothetical protein